MSLREQAKADWLAFSSDDEGFGTSIMFTAPNGFSISVTNLHTKHHLGVDDMGRMVNSKNAHVSVSEAQLVGYPVRNSDGEVAMVHHRVTVADSTGIPKTYKINQAYPDETLGVLVFILGDYVG